MKKTKVMSIGCILVLVFCMFGLSLNVYAKEGAKQIDGSYLTDESESIGYDTKITRGEDLLAGYSKCVRLPNGHLYVGGTTVACQTVERIGLAVAIERAKEEDTTWEAYDAWIVREENTDRIASSKELEVEGGYYYRVVCTHSANSDMSSSFTNGIFIE